MEAEAVAEEPPAAEEPLAAEEAAPDAPTEDTEETEEVTEITEEVVEEEEEEEVEEEKQKEKAPKQKPPKVKKKKKKSPKGTGKKGGKPKKGGKKGKGSVIWAKKRLAAIVPSFSPCPHIHFKQKPADRGKLNKNQYTDLLATPRREPWLEQTKEDNELYPFKRRPLTARTECLAIPNKRYVTANLEEFFDIFTDYQRDHLKDILQTECDMTAESEGQSREAKRPGVSRASSRKTGDQEGRGPGGSGKPGSTKDGRQRSEGGRKGKESGGKGSGRGGKGGGPSSRGTTGKKGGTGGKSMGDVDNFGGSYEDDATKWSEWLSKSMMVADNWATWIGGMVADSEREAAKKEGLTVSEDGKVQLTNEEWQKWTVEIKKNVTDWQSHNEKILQDGEYYNVWKDSKELPMIEDTTGGGPEPIVRRPEDWEEEIFNIVVESLKTVGLNVAGGEAGEVELGEEGDKQVEGEEEKETEGEIELEEEEGNKEVEGEEGNKEAE